MITVKNLPIIVLVSSFFCLAGLFFAVNVSEAEGEYSSFLPFVAGRSNVLFFDDFSHDESGWPIDDDGLVRWSYLAGEYEMLIREEKKWAGALAPVSISGDYSVQVEMRRSEGTESDYGLIFDFQDWDNYYFFVMDAGDQWYGVARIENGNPEVIVPQTFSTKIEADKSINLLKVKRIGSKMDVFVNDAHLDYAQDVGFGGAVGAGLYMESDSNAPAAVRFDNFRVWRPEDQKQADANSMPGFALSESHTSGTMAGNDFSVE